MKWANDYDYLIFDLKAIFYSKEKALEYLHSFPIYKCSGGYDRNICYRTYTHDISSGF